MTWPRGERIADAATFRHLEARLHWVLWLGDYDVPIRADIEKEGMCVSDFVILGQIGKSTGTRQQHQTWFTPQPSLNIHLSL